MTIPRSHCAETDPARRGLALGTAHAARIRDNIDAYRRLFEAVRVDARDLRPYGEQALAEIEQWTPHLRTELVAVAEGAGVQAWEVAMVNARTEILATVGATAEGECSTAVYIGGPGAPHTIQTWDWHDEMAAAKTLTAYRPSAHRTVRAFTEAGVLAKIGVNDAGLGVHFNILSHQDDGESIGVPVHAVARRVLDEAATVSEAADIARSARVSASTVLTVVTYDGRRGDGACIELSPRGTAVVRPDSDGVLLHTNHFLDPGLALGEDAAAAASTHPRYKRMSDRRELIVSTDPAHWLALLRVHEEDGAPLCCHPKPGLEFQFQWRTLLTIGIDLHGRRLRYHDGGPCTATDDSWNHL
ncbi:C45 family peptidase [Streptomyces sp. IB2014 016-6]|uniref:C45 family autoproteolytic acyltransferase/hydolase n=1 Tax=Streptomyces sp. IB2014 016-6 TaxID=2517818 RepID=UPI0011CC4CBB|nr:C45 family peptidase [Streptomyces sp. IB2014 016-6]TXL86669.1 peptidase C45 [Streptomyces sp. IB2014 016-6]